MPPTGFTSSPRPLTTNHATPASGVTVAWYPEVPADVRKSVEPILERWLWVVPTWCHDVRIKYAGDCEDPDDKSVATCEWSLPYRYARITIHGNWMGYTRDVDRESAIVHELVHIALGPMSDQFMALVQELDPPEKLASWAERTHDVSLEGAVVDLTRALMAGAAR